MHRWCPRGQRAGHGESRAGRRGSGGRPRSRRAAERSEPGAGPVGPNIATTGATRDTARWSATESLLTTTSARAIIAADSRSASSPTALATRPGVRRPAIASLRLVLRSSDHHDRREEPLGQLGEARASVWWPSGPRVREPRTRVGTSRSVSQRSTTSPLVGDQVEPWCGWRRAGVRPAPADARLSWPVRGGSTRRVCTRMRVRRRTRFARGSRQAVRSGRSEASDGERKRGHSHVGRRVRTSRRSPAAPRSAPRLSKGITRRIEGWPSSRGGGLRGDHHIDRAVQPGEILNQGEGEDDVAEEGGLDDQRRSHLIPRSQCDRGIQSARSGSLAALGKRWFRHYSTCSTARNASWGISTWPSCFIFFFPSFCFSSSLRLRVMSPP